MIKSAVKNFSNKVLVTTKLSFKKQKLSPKAMKELTLNFEREFEDGVENSHPSHDLPPQEVLKHINPEFN